MTGTLFAAELQPTGVRLRDYQLRAVSRIVGEFDAGKRSTLAVLATGLGKTVLAGYTIRRMVEEQGCRSLFLAHRGELIDQAADAFGNLGLDAAIEQAGRQGRAFGDPHVVVASVQTMQRKRLASWPADYFDLIITDECHHSVADTYANIYDHFAGAKHLGITATPDRGDKVNLGCVFESVAFEMSMLDAMTAPAPGPYLSRLKVVQCEIGVDLSAIRTTAGDLNAADLEDALKPHVEPIANAIKKEVGERPTLVFTPDVGSAQAIATACRSLAMRAEWVSGDDADRAEKVRDYKEGRIQVLANCSLLLEGFDAPRTAAIVLCRPTKSRALYAQMVGRGTRLAHGKADCLLIDFDWLAGKHQLVKPVELLSSRFQADDDDEIEVRKRAQRKLEFGKEDDLLDAIESARKDMDAEKARQEAIRLRVKERDANYRRIQYDPLAGYHAVGLPTQFPREARPVSASEKQIAALRKLGVAVPDDISKRRASMMLDVLCKRIDAGKASLKQVNVLIANGVDPAVARETPFEEASRLIDGFFGNRRN